ncbi:MAG TPA: serine--tRNA ligase [Candidatus Paceibacterota bacterium]
MLDITLIREKPKQVKAGIKAKNADPKLVDTFLELDEKWRSLTKQFDDLRAEQRKLGEARKVEQAKALKEDVKKIEQELSVIDKLRQETLHQMPNLPLASVRVGKDESENQVLREVGTKPKIKSPKDYLTLSEQLGLIDIEKASKTSGSRFGYLRGPAALLELALVNFAMKTLTKEGFVPIIPPVLVNEKAMWSMGYLERGREEVYYIPEDNLYLVGTAEQSVGPMHQDETFDEQALPKRYAAFSSCFRREAGSYGKDTKGILRVHQFDKVEMISITAPDQSEAEHAWLLSLEEKLMQALELPYRVLDICSGDLGDPAAAKYDIEAWMPGQNNGKGEYRETHSTSNTTDFQTRRLNIKYKNKNGELVYAHLLNGTAFAIGRILIAIFENYQTEQGTIRIPQVLQEYLGISEISAV